VLDGIDPSVGDLDDIVEGHKGGLQRGQFHEQAHCTLVVLLQLGQLLATACQSGQLIGVHPIRIGFEDGQRNPGHIILFGAYDLGLGHILQDNLVDITGGELDLGQREGGLLHHLTHQGFGLKNNKNTALKKLPSD